MWVESLGRAVRGYEIWSYDYLFRTEIYVFFSSLQVPLHIMQRAPKHFVLNYLPNFSQL